MAREPLGRRATANTAPVSFICVPRGPENDLRQLAQASVIYSRRRHSSRGRAWPVPETFLGAGFCLLRHRLCLLSYREATLKNALRTLKFEMRPLDLMSPRFN